MLEHIIDKRIFELKQDIKKAKKLKRLHKQKERLENALYKPPIHIMFFNFVDSVFFSFKELVNKGDNH